MANSDIWTPEQLATYRAMQASAKQPKYRNKKTEVDGIVFDSKKESRRYLELKLLEREGEISNLELQPKYEFKVNGVRIGSYKPDFRYLDSDGQLVVEDCKSPASKTTAYRLRKKMMLALHSIEIRET